MLRAEVLALQELLQVARAALAQLEQMQAELQDSLKLLRAVLVAVAAQAVAFLLFLQLAA